MQRGQEFFMDMEGHGAVCWGDGFETQELDGERDK